MQLLKYLMYQGYHSSVASQWLCIYVSLTLSGIDEHIQIITDSQLGIDGSRLWDFDGGRRRIDMVIAAVIFDVSRLSFFCGPTIVMQICKLDSVRD